MTILKQHLIHGNKRFEKIQRAMPLIFVAKTVLQEPIYKGSKPLLPPLNIFLPALRCGYDTQIEHREVIRNRKYK
jgi:hypothetical protein